MSWLPNVLTSLRIFLTPLIAYFILTDRCDLALPLSMLAGFSDAADGFLARRFRWSSQAGAYLDPIADKLLLTSLYVSFGAIDLVPVWLVWLVVGRDILILAMAAAGWALRSVRDFPPSFWGKLSTVVQICAALVLLAACARFSGAIALAPFTVWAVTAVTVWSGMHYVWQGWSVARQFSRRSSEKV